MNLSDERPAGVSKMNATNSSNSSLRRNPYNGQTKIIYYLLVELLIRPTKLLEQVNY